MGDSTFQQPSPEDLDDFVRGDPLAKERVAELVAPQLCRWAWATYKDLPREGVQDVVFDVLAETCHKHARYDPEVSLFTTYVINLINLRIKRLARRVQRLRAREGSTEEGREKPPGDVYNKIDAAEIETRGAREKFYKTVRETLQGLELKFFDLMLQGAGPEAFVKALEREGPFPDPSSEVKKRKARLLRKLRGIAKGLGYKLSDLWGR